MKRLGRFLLFAVACCTPAVYTKAQEHPPVQPQSPTETIHRMAAEYTHLVADNAALFGGRIQRPMPGNLESRYLRDRGQHDRDPETGEIIFPRAVDPMEAYAYGDIFYDGVLYSGVRMKLDLYREELVAASIGSSIYGVVLDPSRFGYADLRGYRIIHIGAPSMPYDLAEGYYQQLYDGRHEILKKEHFEFNPTKREFTVYSIRYYVEKDGVMHRIGRRKGPLLRLFRDRRSELDHFIRTNGLSLRTNGETAVVRIVSEYERLTPQQTQ